MKLTRRNATDLVIGGPARANLLPGEVADNKRARGTMRSMITLVVVAAVVCIAGYGGATFLAFQSEVALMLEEQRTSDLLAKQAEYSEVQSINNTLSGTKDALLAASGPEILWAPYLTDLMGALPGGTVLSDLTVTSLASTESKQTPTIALEPETIATIEFTLTTGDLNQNAAALRALEALPAVTQVLATPISRDGEDPIYKSSFIVRVDDKALSQRFFTPAEIAVGDESTEETP